MEAGGVRPQRRHRSHRWRKADRKKKAKKKKAAPASRVRRLSRGRWREEVSEAIEDVLAKKGVGTPGYSEFDPPVAVLSWDDVSITHDIGRAVFQRLVEKAEFKFDDDFWDIVPLHFGRVRIRAGYNKFHREPRTVWARNAYFKLYRKGFLKCHDLICRTYGEKECAVWRVKLLKGFSERDIRLYTRTVITEGLKEPVAWETVGTTVEDPDPVKTRRGLRWIPEMRDLYKKLRDRGFDVWVISSSNQWSVEEMVGEYGVYRSRVVGIRTKLVDGAITDDVLHPATYGSGKTEAIAMFIGRSPALIVGGESDADMLGFGRGTRIRIVDSSVALPGFEREGDLSQPRFSPVRKPQERLAGRQ